MKKDSNKETVEVWFIPMGENHYELYFGKNKRGKEIILELFHEEYLWEEELSSKGEASQYEFCEGNNKKWRDGTPMFFKSPNKIFTKKHYGDEQVAFITVEYINKKKITTHPIPPARSEGLKMDWLLKKN